MNIKKGLIEFINKEKLIEKNDKILVALSGGPDSVLLLWLLNSISSYFSITVAAAHLNHNLRGEDSKEDEIFVRRLCKNLRVKLYVKNSDVNKIANKTGRGIEETGRKIRYDYFNYLSEKYGYNKIATGHNADDNVETLLLNMIRGTGIFGLKGILPKRDNIIRPILFLTKKEIIGYLKKINLEYRTDLSNFENDYNRNLIRNRILPLFERLNKNFILNLRKLNSNIKELTEFIDKNAEIYTKLFYDKKSLLVFEIKNNNNYFNIFIKSLLRKNLENKFGVIPDYSDFDNIGKLISAEKGSKVNLSGGLCAVRESNSIVFYFPKKLTRKHIQVKIEEKIQEEEFYFKATKYTKKIVYTNDRNIEFIDMDKVESPMILRSWKEGDRINPLGMKGTKRVSKILSESNVTNFNKKKYLVLCDKHNIIWLCGIKLSDKYKVDANSKNVIKLEIGYSFDK